MPVPATVLIVHALLVTALPWLMARRSSGQFKVLTLAIHGAYPVIMFYSMMDMPVSQQYSSEMWMWSMLMLILGVPVVAFNLWLRHWVYARQAAQRA